ncbi:hypothetical protein KKG52_02285 [Patescibacteria group bacterium]|nr:hypothetical protein [Patescibacteria group bacterium]
MNKQKEQQNLLDIVKTWVIQEIPEYRGFRCANCQEYKNKAWYHWLNFRGYLLPVHLCNDKCEKQFQIGAIKTDPAKQTEIDKNSFGKIYKFRPETIERFKKIVKSWSEKEPKLKAFSCDECKSDLEIDLRDGQRKGFHVWWKMPNEKTLAELHFHKNCANKLGIY